MEANVYWIPCASDFTYLLSTMIALWGAYSSVLQTRKPVLGRPGNSPPLFNQWEAKPGHTLCNRHTTPLPTEGVIWTAPTCPSHRVEKDTGDSSRNSAFLETVLFQTLDSNPQIDIFIITCARHTGRSYHMHLNALWYFLFYSIQFWFIQMLVATRQMDFTNS